MDKTILENNAYSWCFACGKDNPTGLHMRFELDDDKCTAYFTPRREHQSYPGRMHGGLVAVLLDEVTGNYLFAKEGKPSYTAKIEIRYRQPLASCRNAGDNLQKGRHAAGGMPVEDDDCGRSAAAVAQARSRRG